MSIYDDASLIYYPSGYKAGKAYSLKPTDGSGDLTFTRASTATRVNAEGLIETASVLGADLVTNGDFATDTDWIKNTGWTISGGAANCDGTNGGLRQNNLIPLNTKVKVSFTVTNYTSGSIQVKFAPTTYSVSLYGNGIYTVITDGDNTINGDLQLISISFIGSIDNVSVKEVITNNVPRIDYTGGGCGKLLLEPQRTNVITQSQSFADYYINRASKVDLSTPSIFTSGSMAEFTATSAAAFFGKVFGGISVGTIYTVSAFFDISQGLYAGITDSSSNYRIFNLQTGSVIGIGGGSIGLTATSVRIGVSNYYRVSFTITPSTSGNHFLIIGTSLGTNSTTNEKVVAGYFQREDAASYSTSYIPTTSTAVTRVADEASKSGISSLIGQTEGTIYLEYQRFNDGDIFVGIINNASNYVEFNLAAANGTKIEIRGASPTSSIPSAIRGGSSLPFTTYKVAIRYKENDNALFQNGVKIASDETAFLDFSSANLTEFRFARANGNQPFRGLVTSLIIDNNSLSDAELSALTT